MAQSGQRSRCRIVVDAMGGDFAPQNAVVGAIDALREDPSIELLLVGRKQDILDVLEKNHLEFDAGNIIHADEVISMSDSPTMLKTKKDSSIVVGVNLVRDGRADAFVSAGNTGAVHAASTLFMGRLDGVSRPTIGTFMPSEGGVCTIFDAGANVDSKARFLFEYAVMGSIFVREIYGIQNPTVGLLNVGEEDSKGPDVIKETFGLLKNSQLNFIGNIEGRDILKGRANVVVCDGFVGNIILKFGESMPKLLKAMLKEYASKGILNKLKVAFAYSALKEALKPMDYQLHGGVPLLGVRGISIIGHGSSTPLAIKNMVFRAAEMYNKDLTNKIETSIRQYAISK